MKIDGLTYEKKDGNRDVAVREKEKALREKQKTPSSEGRYTSSPTAVTLPSGYTKAGGAVGVRILFILSGGEVRERNYFKLLKDDHQLTRMKVAFASKEGQGLNPTQMLDLAKECVEKKKFVTQEATYRFERDNGDVIYLLQDIDEFEPEIRKLADEEQPDCLRWIYSNPAFEMWLYYHYFAKPLPELRDAIEKPLAERSKWLKGHLQVLIPGGVKTTKAIAQMRQAIDNSKGNYSEERGLPTLFATRMHNLGEDILSILGSEFDEMLSRKTAASKAMMERFKKPIVKRIRYDGEKIRRLIGELSKWADENPLKLPHAQDFEIGVSCYQDNRAFPINYKLEKAYFDEASQVEMPVNTDELFMVNIQNEIYHFYNVLFIQNSPLVSYTIEYSEIKTLIETLALDSQYAILCSFHLNTFDILYGGEPLKETNWGYSYKNIRIYDIPARGRFMIIMRAEQLPRADFKIYEGDNAEFELIDDGNLIYSNIHQMKDLDNYYGLSIMRVVKFLLPQKGSFRFMKLNIVDYAKEKSELGKMKKADVVRLQYQEGDFVKYNNKVCEITRISDDGELSLAYDRVGVSLQDIAPVRIDGEDDENIYYDPVVAAFIVAPGKAVPVAKKDYRYYMEVFKNVKQEDGTSLYDRVQECHFAYVHELQHWLLETQGQSGLKMK